MLNKIPNLPIINKIPSKPSAGNFTGSPKSGLTSITRAKTTANFHQFGDSVSHTSSGNRSDKIFGSINSVLKNKPNSPTSTKTTTPSNQNFKPLIK